jgi:predicted adenine nucleotide alpha hydrolase (AANH) superfamily ATPase
LFGVLSWFILDYCSDQKKKFEQYALLVFVIICSYALFCEWFQKLIPTRTPDFFDLFFGILGSGLAIYFFYLKDQEKKSKLLLHICCVGCGVYIAKLLKEKFRVYLYFYNPNIFPENEYDKRLSEAKNIAKKFGLKLITEKYNHIFWLKKIEGHEHDQEKGERCLICYHDRLEKTAQKAKELKFDFFSTTLTISPHKDASQISKIGKELEEKYLIKYLDENFKKQDGYLKSSRLSRKLGLYRQNYCGCEFSQRK